ncbi:hypothetical protein EMIHUDRAFT_460221 [Emiliania huxleyi CCMP1516]|uniref:Uncharacterized protein n=2 Tax=Emiliania huxleyi TaxID=2903 RepID=A0A0D3I0M2_EMIH1|nr:hypothetical protein EMIHUDRAFT_460221 [Emiliania huxleyi CCMP1516]EOD04807.1 hypothetical protein EMIHUDRAFT_460221 [Emiliania huxleyi CCMP1516]|eukprot:XP_005757236.1 hypothetical protein EMIHUDRAFT_460221 [Emiliania huxleyi CCMP1516]
MSLSLLLVTAGPGLNVPHHVPLRHGRPVAVRLAIGELGDWVSLKKSTALGASATVGLPDKAVALLERVQSDSQAIEFAEVVSVIDECFDVTETAFRVGDVESAAGENMGSSKLLAFGKLAGLSEQETLCLFGQYYKDVCASPADSDHPNIRAFMAGGWGAVQFPWGLSVSVPVDGKAFGTSKDAVQSALEASAQISGDDEWDPDSEIWIP